ncbi:hypothetical protein Mapa_014930 [Marchantia paleacea]|nr:hypothetical protein Mapa_014930 [Marchantia paleacea]
MSVMTIAMQALCLCLVLGLVSQPALAYRRIQDDRPPIPDFKGGIARGPSSSVDSYLVPITIDNGIYLTAVITVGDSADNGYKLVGVPDGLGAYDNRDGTFTLLMNHEIESGKGAVRDHGGSGAFVSKWTIRKKDFRVIHGEDLIKKVSTWNRETKTYNNPEISPAVNMSRFCSATLADPSAFYNKKTGKGTKDRIFMNGEETDVDGRAFAHIATGDYAGHTFELPYLGQGSFENQVAHPSSGDKTVVIGLDDGGHNRVFVYVGDKKYMGSPIERAGLTNGKLYVIAVEGIADEIIDGGNLKAHDKRRFKCQLVGDGDLSGRSGIGTEVEKLYLPFNNTKAAPIPNTKFDRPEDGTWDPSNRKDFYFATTSTFNVTGRHSRLWKLRFDDPNLRTSLEGTIEVMINGPDGNDRSGPKMMDNIGITKRGEIIIKEDLGKNVFLSRVWRYNLRTDKLDIISQHNPALFSAPIPVKTTDEESSGVISMDDLLGLGWYLGDVQAHRTLPNPLVEDGQLYAMYVPPYSQK